MVRLRPYALEVTQTIRAKDPDNPITSVQVHGVRTFKMRQITSCLIKIHICTAFLRRYTRTVLRDRLDYALSKKAAVFVTEWGTSDASGNGGPYCQNRRHGLISEQSWCELGELVAVG